MTAFPCRRCGQTTGDMTKLWKPSPNGELAAYTAQCRNPCGRPPKPGSRPRPAKPDRLVVVTATRPGRCAGCTWDVTPGSKIVHLGEGRWVHVECTPADTPLDEGDTPSAAPVRHRTRTRVR